MANMTGELNDYILLQFLINPDNFSFISNLTRERYIAKITSIFNTKSQAELEKDGFKCIFNPSLKEEVNVLDFWERLIIDAIKYLKWHDLKEFPLNNSHPRRPSDSEEKNEAFDKISEGSLGVYYLKEYFSAFIQFERLLYGAEQFYRDHVYHILKVWLIGQYIISNMIEGDFPIVIQEENKIVLNDSGLAKSLKNKAILYAGEEDAIWCLIALTHDLGYPLSKIENINNSLKKMMEYYAKTGLEEFSFSFPQQNQFINDSILKYISSKIVPAEEKKGQFDTHIQAKYYLKFSRSFELFKHGLISCIVLVKNLIYFLETNFDHNASTNLGDAEEARQFIIRREILRAIASHTCPEIYHIRPNTFSFILLLADEMQSWGRPTFEDMALGIDKRYFVRLNKFDAARVSFSITCNEISADQKPASLFGLFMEKASFFKKLLRVAVDSLSDRRFEFHFELIDEVKNKCEFLAEPSKPVLMTINGEKIEHLQLMKLAELHRKDIYKTQKNINEFIHLYFKNK